MSKKKVTLKVASSKTPVKAYVAPDSEQEDKTPAKVVLPSEKKSARKAEKAPKVKKATMRGMLCELIIKSNMGAPVTDDEIYEKVIKDWPKTKKGFISANRGDMNASRYAKNLVEESKVKLPLVRFVKDADGKYIALEPGSHRGSGVTTKPRKGKDELAKVAALLPPGVKTSTFRLAVPKKAG